METTTKRRNRRALNKANVEKVEKEITDKKELKYQYPDEATTLKKRKAFRNRVRKTMNQYHEEIEALKKSGSKKDKARARELNQELAEFMDEVLVTE